MSDSKSLVGKVNVVPSEMWGVFDKPDVSVDTTGYQWVEYRRVGSLDLNDVTGDISISNEDLSVYVLPMDSFLEIRLRIISAVDDLAFILGDDIAVQNHVMNIFSKVELTIDNTSVDDYNDPGVVLHIVNMIKYTTNYKNTATLWGWAEDGPRNFTSDITTNTGFASRVERTEEGFQASYWIPLGELFGFFRDVPVVMRGSRITVNLTKQITDNLTFFREAGIDDGKLDLRRVGIWYAVAKPDGPTSLNLERMLANGTKSVKLWNALTLQKSSPFTSIGSTESDFVFNVIRGVPMRLYMVMMTIAKLNAQTENHLVFDEIDVTRLQVQLNSISFPQTQLLTDFVGTESSDSARAFHFALQGGGMIHDRSGGSLIDYISFQAAHRIFVIDLIMEDTVFDAKQNFQISFNIRHAPITEDFQVWTVIESMRKLTLEGISSKINVER